MVTKAIERAQNTVEQRNAEIRKNVLKYDEVMNEQRKVIYKRRDQILEGADLRGRGAGVPRRGRRRHHREPTAWPTFSEEWDIDGLIVELGGLYCRRRSRPSSSTSATPPTRSTTSSWPRPPRYYERRETELGAELMREVERQVMLRIIDQRWREHLYEMDYLRRASTCGPWARRTRSWSGSGGLQDVRRDDARHRPGLRALRDARPGRAAGAAGRPPVVQNVQTHSADDVAAGRHRHAAGRGAPAADDEAAGGARRRPPPSRRRCSRS